MAANAPARSLGAPKDRELGEPVMSASEPLRWTQTRGTVGSLGTHVGCGVEADAGDDMWGFGWRWTWAARAS